MHNFHGKDKLLAHFAKLCLSPRMALLQNKQARVEEVTFGSYNIMLNPPKPIDLYFWFLIQTSQNFYCIRIVWFYSLKVRRNVY